MRTHEHTHTHVNVNKYSLIMNIIMDFLSDLK